MSNNKTITAMKQNVNNAEFTYTLANKSMRQVLTLAKSLNQVVKQFQGIMRENISVEMRGGVVRTFTVGEFFANCGVELEKGKVTFNGIKNAWKMFDAEGKMAIVRSIPAKTMTNEDYPEAKRIYQYITSESGEEWKTVSIKDKVAVEDGKWTADIVLRGLLQSKYATKFEKQITDSKNAWEQLDKVYVFEKRTNKGGEENKAIEYAKELVVF